LLSHSSFLAGKKWKLFWRENGKFLAMKNEKFLALKNEKLFDGKMIFLLPVW
jgi:hypothetical protein